MDRYLDKLCLIESFNTIWLAPVVQESSQHLVTRNSIVQFPWSVRQIVFGQDTEPQTAPEVLVGTLHGSHRQKYMKACMKYCKLLWTTVSAKCPKCKWLIFPLQLMDEHFHAPGFMNEWKWMCKSNCSMFICENTLQIIQWVHSCEYSYCTVVQYDVVVQVLIDGFERQKDT